MTVHTQLLLFDLIVETMTLQPKQFVLDLLHALQPQNPETLLGCQFQLYNCHQEYPLGRDLFKD